MTLEKSRRAWPVAFISAGEAPSVAKFSWYRRGYSGSAWPGKWSRSRAQSAITPYTVTLEPCQGPSIGVTDFVISSSRG